MQLDAISYVARLKEKSPLANALGPETSTILIAIVGNYTHLS